LPARQQDRVVACGHCPAHVVLAEDGLRLIDVQYAKAQGKQPPEVSWVPFWVLSARVSLISRRAQTAWTDDETAHAMWAEPQAFFVPAGELPLTQVRSLGYNLLLEPPPLVALSKRPQGARMAPAISDAADAAYLAEFLVLEVEAQRDDFLRHVEFELTIERTDLWAIPCGDGKPLL
jgi:hypothetical protein